MKNHIFLFTGEETFLLQQQVKSWKEAFLKKHGDLNLVHLDGARLSVAELRTQIEAMPFLGDKRLIFVDHFPFEASKKKSTSPTDDDAYLRALENIPDSSVVVFIQPKPDKRKKLYKALVKKAEVKTFNQLEGIQLHEWIDQQFKSKGVTLDYALIQHLISLTGSNLWQLNQEIKKLSDFSASTPITESVIDDLVVPTVEANVFRFTDALGARQPKKAIELLHRSVESGDSLNQLFYMVVRQFRLFLQVGDYLRQFPHSNPAKVAQGLKLHPFVVKNIVRQVRFFDLDFLKKAYADLLAIDHQLKTGGIRISTEDQAELSLAIEKFIITFCS